MFLYGNTCLKAVRLAKWTGSGHGMHLTGKEKGEFMRKGIASKCLCIALASAMVFGDVGIVSAAESSSADSKEAVSVVADESTADVAVSAPRVDYLNVYEEYGSDIRISAGGAGCKAVLYINGKKAAEESYDYDSYYLSVSKEIDAVPGATYTVEVRIANSEGTVVKSQEKLVATSVGFRSGTSAITAESISGKVSETGIKQPDGIRVSANIHNQNGHNYKYEVYRSTKSNGGFKCIYKGTSSESWRLEYVDTTAKAGAAYYYKVRILRGTSEYVTSDKVLAVSGAAGVRYGKPECSFDAYVSGRDKGANGTVNLSIWSDLANRYDIYRSTSATKGFKKIATAYANYYTDAKVKKGTVYYYKIIPMYYDSTTGKTITGNTTKAIAAKYLMDGSAPTLTQVGTNSMKCEWYAENSADVSYEVWCRRSDVVGDAFVKKAVTKKNSCVIKGLAANGEYDAKIRTVKKAGSVVKYAMSASSRRIMGYTSSVQDLNRTPVKSNADSKTVAVYYQMTWYRDWNASGYKITAYNNYTNKKETVKTITSGKTTSYTFKNTGVVGKELKYTDIEVLPYKGKTIGVSEYDGYELNTLPSPAKVKVSRKSGTAVTVAWTAVKGATEYTVIRTTALGVTQTLATVKGTSYVDTHVTNGLGYTYSVYASTSKTAFNSGWSAGYGIYFHKLSTPQIKAVTNPVKGTASVKWAKTANTKVYKVYRSDKANGKYVQVASTSRNVCVYADKKLKKGKTYYYKVVAYTINDCGQTVKSAASKAKGVKISK